MIISQIFFFTIFVQQNVFDQFQPLGMVFSVQVPTEPDAKSFKVRAYGSDEVEVNAVDVESFSVLYSYPTSLISTGKASCLAT